MYRAEVPSTLERKKISVHGMNKGSERSSGERQIKDIQVELEGYCKERGAEGG